MYMCNKVAGIFISRRSIPAGNGGCGGCELRRKKRVLLRRRKRVEGGFFWRGKEWWDGFWVFYRRSWELTRIRSAMYGVTWQELSKNCSFQRGAENSKFTVLPLHEGVVWDVWNFLRFQNGGVRQSREGRVGVCGIVRCDALGCYRVCVRATPPL